MAIKSFFLALWNKGTMAFVLVSVAVGNYLFTYYPFKVFKYTYHVLIFIIILFLGTYLFDFYVNSLEKTNKILYKSLKQSTSIYRWGFTSFALILLISKIEKIPIFSLGIFDLIFFVSIVWYTIYLFRKRMRDYQSRLKNQERGEHDAQNMVNAKYLPVKKKK